MSAAETVSYSVNGSYSGTFCCGGADMTDTATLGGTFDGSETIDISTCLGGTCGQITAENAQGEQVYQEQVRTFYYSQFCGSSPNDVIVEPLFLQY